MMRAKEEERARCAEHAHGAEAGLYSARASYLAGFAGAANVLAGERYGVPIVGTMAHSFVQVHGDEMTAFEREAAKVPVEWTIGFNPAHAVFPMARKMMQGELAFREGHHDVAFAALREAIAIEDELLYDEPPSWLQPVRHALGALMMAAGRYADAEQVYRDDLAKNPKNGWALLGLEKALRMQGKTDGLDDLIVVEAAGAHAQQAVDVAPGQMVVAGDPDVGDDQLAREMENHDRPAVLRLCFDIDGAEHVGELEDALRLGELFARQRCPDLERQERA